jgi:hypothetical protein
MNLTECCRQTNGDAQEVRQLERAAEQPIEGVAAGVLQHGHSPPRAASESQRPHRPPGIQFGREGVFVLEPVEACRCRPVRDGRPHQDRAGGVGLPAAVQGELSAFSERLQQISGNVHRTALVVIFDDRLDISCRRARALARPSPGPVSRAGPGRA